MDCTNKRIAFTGVAVKLAVVPAQMVVAGADMVTDGVTVAATV